MFTADEWNAIHDVWMRMLVFKGVFFAVAIWLSFKVQRNAAVVKFKVVASASVTCAVLLLINLGMPREITFYETFKILSYDLAILITWASMVGLTLTSPSRINYYQPQS